LTNESITSDPHSVDGSVAYGLDPVGNRLTESSSIAGVNSGSYGYNADDEVSTETYDSNGNTLSGRRQEFHLRCRESLDRDECQRDNSVADLRRLRQRVAKTVNGVTTKYLVEDDVNPTGYPQVLDELTGSTVTRTYTYGLQTHQPGQLVSGVWTPSFYGYDAAAMFANSPTLPEL